MITWKIHHKAISASTNLDALKGEEGDVFTADFQSAGRGRLDHKWDSPAGENLMMSAVVSVEGLPPEKVATLPLVVGVAIADAILPTADIKWPNDIWYKGKKVAGILCERHEDKVIVGIGINVGAFPSALVERATSLKAIGKDYSVIQVRDLVLKNLAEKYHLWKRLGFEGELYQKVIAYDYLRGKTISVRQSDEDVSPIIGRCEGIAKDGALIVAGTRIYAGEAHIEGIF